jgi:hypothetical protein
LLVKKKKISFSARFSFNQEPGTRNQQLPLTLQPVTSNQQLPLTNQPVNLSTNQQNQ